MAYIGSLPSILSQTQRDSFTGNGSTTVFTLTRSVGYSGSIVVVVGGVVQDETTYFVNDKSLTFTTAPSNGTNIDVVHLQNPYGVSEGGSGGGATGAAGEKIFYENETTVNYSYSITAGMNAMSAGPITIADGVTVAVPDGSRWTVV